MQNTTDQKQGQSHEKTLNDPYLKIATIEQIMAHCNKAEADNPFDALSSFLEAIPQKGSAYRTSIEKPLLANAKKILESQLNLDQLRFVERTYAGKKMGRIAQTIVWEKTNGAQKRKGNFTSIGDGGVVSNALSELAEGVQGVEREFGEVVKPKARPAGGDGSEPMRRTMPARGSNANPAPRIANAGKLLPYCPKNSLFKVIKKYEPNSNYPDGFEITFYSRDRVEERDLLKSEVVIDKIINQLEFRYDQETGEERITPEQIFGHSSKVAARGFNGFNMNVDRIHQEILNGHPRSGKLIKAFIFFQRILEDTVAGQRPIEIFRYDISHTL